MINTAGARGGIALFGQALHEAVSAPRWLLGRTGGSIMGHAGALVHDPGGAFEGAADPRSDGGVAGF